MKISIYEGRNEGAERGDLLAQADDWQIANAIAEILSDRFDSGVIVSQDIEDLATKVLDHGLVGLYNLMADDLSVVNSARISFGVRKNELDDSDKGLINFLMKNHHGTPFEHNAFTFHVKAPIFVFREWQRHRIGSFNEMSARYTTLPRHFYIPQSEDVRVRIGKPGHYSHIQADEHVANSLIESLANECSNSYSKYLTALQVGIAPEQARMFLHVNHFSQMFWTVNARSLMNFLSLRNAPTAQWEIRQYAQEIERIFEKYMPVTYLAWNNNGRVAP